MQTSLRSAITEVAARDEVLANLVRLAGPLRWRPRNPDGRFGALVRSIVYQQLAGAAAQAIHGRVLATAEGGVLTPETLTAVPDEALRAAGLSAGKLASLRDLSAKTLDGAVLAPLGDPFAPYRSIAARYCWEAVHLFRGGTDPALR